MADPKIRRQQQMDDYSRLETAITETDRGRRFLREYLDRNRTPDTRALLKAIQSLQQTILQSEARTAEPAAFDEFRMNLIEMSKAIADTRAEIAAINPEADDSRIHAATEELDAIVAATEKATSDILGAAEEIQEIAWCMREKNVEPGACDLLDGHATDIYTACSFQDITGQRTTKVIKVLSYLEARINAMIDIWGLSGDEGRDNRTPSQDQQAGNAEKTDNDTQLLNGPQSEGEGIRQEEVDNLFQQSTPLSHEDVEPDIDGTQEDVVSETHFQRDTVRQFADLDEIRQEMLFF